MEPMSAITTGVAAIKAATDIAKLIRGADAAIDQATLKNQIADLMLALADIKESYADIRDLVRENDEQIAKLEAALAGLSGMVFEGDVYYKVDKHGAVTSNPQCTRCWDVDEKMVTLLDQGSCPECKTYFEVRRGDVRVGTVIGPH